MRQFASQNERVLTDGLLACEQVDERVLTDGLLACEQVDETVAVGKSLYVHGHKEPAEHSAADLHVNHAQHSMTSTMLNTR